MDLTAHKDRLNEKVIKSKPPLKFLVVENGTGTQNRDKMKKISPLRSVKESSIDHKSVCAITCVVHYFH